MRRPVLYFVVVHLFLLLTVAVGQAGNQPIIGGTPATAGEYPTVVAIEVGQGLCTGTLITKDWVLTAAHCVTPAVVGVGTQQELTASVRVHFNTVNVFQSPGMVVGASDTIPDPGFDINNLGSHDSGLIKLATPVTTVKPVPINLIAADAPIGVHVTMVGFGATAVGGGGQIGVEYVVDQTSESCASDGGGSDANLLCFNQTDGKGKCEGDSGGPSFAMVSGKLTEVGITSFGDQTCSMFGADTRTDAEKAFILQHVPELQCMKDSDCPMGDECFQNQCIVTPFSTGGLGSTCTGNSECDSGTCAAGPGGMKCTMGCTMGATNACPSGLTCTSTGGSGSTAGACWPADGGGCCDASGAGAPTAIFGFILVGLVLRRRRPERA